LAVEKVNFFGGIITILNYEKIKNIRKQIQTQYPEFPFPENSYLVLYSARSGSNLLCKYLTKVGIGNPVEAFNPNISNRKRLNWGIDYKDPIEHLHTSIKQQSVNNIMGMKLSIPHFNLFLTTARAVVGDASLSESEMIEVIFPNVKYIHIQRKGKIRQAISFSKAKQNGIWLQKVGEDKTYLDYIIPAVYDREHIECCFDKLLMEDAAWNHFLTRHHLPFLHVWYEDLAKEPEKTVNEVYNFLGIEGKEVVRAPLRKQSNTKSKDWEAKFRKETPWLQNKSIKEALENGDLLSLATARNVMITEQRENERYWQMPATKFKWFRKWFIRGKRKLNKIFNKSKRN
jgi:LPS sulfotransferase NodH